MDFTWPSVYFAYLFFALSTGVAIFFLVRSARDGYWGKDGEDVKFRMLHDDDDPRRSHE